MSHSLLSVLPQSSSGKSGWPWTEETYSSLCILPEGKNWPKISIVTPSYNQAQFIEETIRSVLLQGYPNLEYIIIDGGSTDGSVEIIQQYASWISYWISEPDGGQSFAINKGFARASGEIMAWLNSDDYYAPGALIKIALMFLELKTEWVAGKCYTITLDGILVRGWNQPRHDIERWFINSLYAQPGVFWRRSLWEKTTKIDESLNYSFDYDLWLQFVQYQPFPAWTEQYLAYFRHHGESKTVTNRPAFVEENQLIYARYQHYLSSRKSRFKLWLFRREEEALDILPSMGSINHKAITLLRAFCIAPWIILNKKFLYHLLMPFISRRRSTSKTENLEESSF